MPSLVSEADLARACTDLLALDGWRALKTDPVSKRQWGKGFGEKGMADYLYLRYEFAHASDSLMAAMMAGERAIAQVMWVEWKIPRGRVAPKQHEWRERERARGGLSLIAGVDFHASIEGFFRWYSQSGLQRRRLQVGAKPIQNVEAR